MNNLAKKIKISFFISIIGATLTYSFYQSRDYLKGPLLEISQPLDGLTYYQNILALKGQTKNIAYLSLNDRQIFVDENGILNEELLLSPGYNIIKVVAEDKYQRKNEKQLELIYSPNIINEQ